DLRRARLFDAGDGHLDVRQRLPVLQCRIRHRDSGRHHHRGHRRRRPVRSLAGEELMTTNALDASTRSQPAPPAPNSPSPRTRHRSRPNPAVTITALIGALIWITPLVLLIVSALLGVVGGLIRVFVM